MPVEPGAQVECLGVGDALAVRGAVNEKVVRQRPRVGVRSERVGVVPGPPDGVPDRSPQRVVRRRDGVAAAVPAAEGVAHDVAQQPPRAGLHAELVDPVAPQVVGAPQDDPLLGRSYGQVGTIGQRTLVEHRALVALDVELDPGAQLLVRPPVERVARADHPVVGDGQEGATQGIDVRRARRVRVRGRAFGGFLLPWTQRTADAAAVPGCHGWPTSTGRASKYAAT